MGNYLAKEAPTRKILMLGLDGAGKSTILRTIKPPSVIIEERNPTIGMFIYSISVENLKIEMWDVTHFQNRIIIPWWNLFDSTSALVWVVDSSEALRFQESKIEFDNMLT